MDSDITFGSLFNLRGPHARTPLDTDQIKRSLLRAEGWPERLDVIDFMREGLRLHFGDTV